MSMNNYAISGYGVNYEKIKKFINRSKLIDAVYNGELIEDEVTDMSNSMLLQEALQLQDSILEFISSDRVEGYALIWHVAPWTMYHKDYRYLKTEEDAKEYIWEKLSEFLQPTLTKESFMEMINYIDDSYCG